MSLTWPGRHPALIMAASGFVLVAGMGIATTVLKETPRSPEQLHTVSNARPTTGSDRALAARLKNYAQSIDGKNYSTKPTASKLLPDVKTMIERLETRLKTTPEDTEGWRMLGWSYFNMARYKQAVAAYAKAVELDPKSSDLARAYKIAKAKDSEVNHQPATPSGQTTADDMPGEKQTAHKEMSPAETPTRRHDPAIRSMVDGLAERLARAPRDVAGWTRLMRSRVVLGEEDVAITAFRAALDVFKDDSAASGKIMTAAIELGLATE
ncbi:MAG: tetratricopeptide repeat protein [Alphaproteobacteria bacterium]|nr:tetratricopeptide repeat protein [Alphaproteobacteria bacterium]